MSFSRAHRFIVSASVTLALAATRMPRAGAQVAEVDVRSQLFYEPSDRSSMLVIAPEAGFSLIPADWLTIDASYAADIVSGATEAVKAGPLQSATPDIVSSASITDLRHVIGGAIGLVRAHTHVSGGYSRGFENDYVSNTITVSAGADFLKRNTELEVSYSHGFDEVCDLAVNASQASTLRQRLPSSDGCFGDAADRRAVGISVDNFQGSWTQSWTSVFATQVVLTGSLQEGLLANPYRAVVIGPAGEFAQEHHPDTRTRGAAALRGKYFIRGLDTAIGFGARGYRDTWEVTSMTYELDAERDIAPTLRVRAHGRFYSQSGALFWSDDYTGGEPVTGPRGRYFSGDRELSPLESVLGGLRFTVDSSGAPGERVGGAFLDFETSVGGDVVKTFLEDFTWAGQDPNDTLALILSFNVTGSF